MPPIKKNVLMFEGPQTGTASSSCEWHLHWPNQPNVSWQSHWNSGPTVWAYFFGVLDNCLRNRRSHKQLATGRSFREG